MRSADFTTPRSTLEKEMRGKRGMLWVNRVGNRRS